MATRFASSRAEPAHHCAPTYAKTLGPAVCELNEAVGFKPDDDQAAIHDVLFARDDKNRSVAFETAVVAGRQNLKTATMQQAALAWLFLTEEPLTIWSAHQWDTVKAAWRALDQTIGSYSWLSQRVRRRPMNEAFELKSGAMLLFKIRSKAGGRGLSGNKVILDEAFALEPEHMGALVPTLSAMPDPQLLIGSSAPLASSDVLRSIMQRGRAHSSSRLAYWEWCAPGPEIACDAGLRCSHAIGTAGCAFDKPEMLRAANPAYGRRLLPATIAAEREVLSVAEFARERMGWGDESDLGEKAISAPHWAASADVKSKRPTDVAFGFAVRPDLSGAVIAVVGRRLDGRTHAELVANLEGTRQLVPRLVALCKRWKPCAVALNNAGASTSFILPLAEAGIRSDPGAGQWELQALSAKDYAAASMGLAADVLEHRFRHLDEGALTVAALAARKRPLADGWAFSAKGADIVALEAVAVARQAFASHAANPVGPVFASWR